MSSFIKEDSNILIGELVPKAIFIGVVHPLGHPDKMFRLCNTWSAHRCWRNKLIQTLISNHYSKEMFNVAIKQTCWHGGQAINKDLHRSLSHSCWSQWILTSCAGKWVKDEESIADNQHNVTMTLISHTHHQYCGPRCL